MEISLTPLRSITSLVVVAHLLLLACLIFFAPSTPIAIKPKSFKVQTVQLQPTVRAPIAMKELSKPQEKTLPPEPPSPPPPPVKEQVKPTPIPSPPPPKPAVAKPQAKAIAKPKPEPAAAPKKSPPPPKPVAAKAEPPAKNVPSKAALDALKQKLAAMPAVTAVPVSGKETKVGGDAPLAYEQELVTRLKILLKLPEMGDVRVALTINRQGKVVKTEILSSANPANRKAVESHLPSIHFPPFGQAFPGENTHTFTLTLTNHL